MADLLQSIRGVLVGCEARAYEGFTDQAGETRPGGVTRTVYVSQSFAAAPVEVKVPPAHEATYAELFQMGFGAQVEVVAVVKANNSRVTLRLASAEAFGNGKSAAERAAAK